MTKNEKVLLEEICDQLAKAIAIIKGEYPVSQWAENGTMEMDRALMAGRAKLERFK
jgi:hypothetical protein